MDSNERFDVIVVGGGGSGLAAACSVAERGGRVLLLEKQRELGGTTGIAVGSFTACNTELQQAAGIPDCVDDHAEDAGRFARPEIEAKNNEPLRRYFLAHSAETLKWLMDKGLTFYGPSPEPPNRVARMHNVIPGAKAYIATLQMEINRLGGRILCGANVTALHQKKRRVVGVTAEWGGSEVRWNASRAVVLAAGDYASCSELIAEHKGREYGQLEGINPRADGDGHRLVQQAGGQLVNMDVTYGPELRFVPPVRKPFQQLLPSSPRLAAIMGAILRRLPRRILQGWIKRLLVTWQHPEDVLFDDGAILINREGRRFANELRWPEREISVANQPGKIAYLLIDGRLSAKYSRWPHFVSTAPDIAYAYVADYLRLRPDVSFQARTLEQCSRAAGLPSAILHQTVDQVNRSCLGEADPFGREKFLPLEREPWVILGPVKAYFTTTEGGAAISEQFEVLDGDGQPIEGLYAVGQNGLGGMILFGHGLHIAWAMTSGRLVGRHIMSTETNFKS